MIWARLQSLWKWLIGLVDVVSTILVAAIPIVLGLQILLRSAFNSPVVWSEELASLFFVWAVFLGAVVVARHGGHLSADVIGVLLSKRQETFRRLLIALVGVSFMVLLLSQAYPLAARFQNARSPAMHYSMSLLFMPVVVASALMIVEYLRQAICIAVTLVTGRETAEAKDKPEQHLI